MKDTRITLKKIIYNNAYLGKEHVKRILILYEERVSHLGDFYINANKLRIINSFFSYANIEVIFKYKEDEKIYNSLLKNIPYLNTYYSLSREQIELKKYQVVFCISRDEEGLLKFLHERYGNEINNDRCRLSVFSISNLFVRPGENCQFIFPFYRDLGKNEHVLKLPGEVYLDEEERKWGEDWLLANGLKENEQLYVLLDAASRKDKLLNLAVYFEYVTHLLSRENVRILNFDEKDLGKEEFYREWLPHEQVDKIIFSKGLGLREALCIIGARYTRLVFGPCTGLMHCASGIYNNYVRNGMDVTNVPLLITYTGYYYPEEGNAYSFWGSSPLVNCLLLNNKNGKPELITLSDVSDEEKKKKNSLPCNEYSADMLIGFTDSLFRLREKAH